MKANKISLSCFGDNGNEYFSPNFDGETAVEQAVSWFLMQMSEEDTKKVREAFIRGAQTFRGPGLHPVQENNS